MPLDEKELFEQWKAERASRGEPSTAFTDEVMSSIGSIEARRRAGLMATLVALAYSRPGRVTMGTVATAAFIFRLSQILAVFIAR